MRSSAPGTSTSPWLTSAIASTGCCRADLSTRTLRLWSIIGAALAHRRLGGGEADILMEHITHYSMVRCDLLSIFHAVCRFIQRHYMERVSPWATARQELRAYRSMMVVARTSWRGSWHPVVFAADASLSGYGISSTIWSPCEVAAVGRVPERRRWKLGAGIAREHALEQAGVVRASRAVLS